MRPWAFISVCLFAALVSLPVAGQGESEKGTLAERYQQALRALEEQRSVATKTEVERDWLRREAESLREKLIANAEHVQSLEKALSQTEARLAELQSQANEIAAGFARERVPVAHLLAVLQRLDRDQPPALALRPEDSLAAARGAMLLGAMLPPLYQRAADLARKLATLRTTLFALEQKRKEVRLTAAELGRARLKLAALLESRSAEAAHAEQQLSEIHDVTEEIAHEAEDLKSLIERIARLRAQSGERMTIVAAESAAAPGIQKGQLRSPVVGTMTRGGPDSPGPITAKGGGISGLWFTSGSGAQAVAPTDGEVVFAGPYQKFGQVLILEIAGGYDLVLAGLGRIDVHIGDTVLAGEPVGILPLTKEAHLYMELRRGGQVIDPAPWLAGELRKAKRS